MNLIHRITLLALCFLLLAQSSAQQSATPPPMQLPEGKKVIVAPQALTNKAPARADHAFANAYAKRKFAGYPCMGIYPIDLVVKKNDKTVHPSSTHPVVKQGDCILWRAVAQDGGAASIAELKFVDTDKDAAAMGKTKSDYPAGVYCVNAGATCLLVITLADGTYRYQASVVHEKTVKLSDPELEVSCGTNCGDPGDFHPVPARP